MRISQCYFNIVYGLGNIFFFVDFDNKPMKIFYSENILLGSSIGHDSYFVYVKKRNLAFGRKNTNNFETFSLYSYIFPDCFFIAKKFFFNLFSDYDNA